MASTCYNKAMAEALTTDERLDKIDQQLERIAKAVVKGFDRIDKTLEEKASNADIQRALSLLDALAKRQEISDDERLIMAHQLTQLHDWVEQAAERINLKFAH
jgi:hypothetical protein